MATPGQPRQLTPDIPVIQRNTPSIQVPQGSLGMEMLQAALSRLAERRSGEEARREESQLARDIEGLRQKGSMEQIAARTQGDLTVANRQSELESGRMKEAAALSKTQMEDDAQLNDPFKRLQRSLKNAASALGLSKEANLMEQADAYAKFKQDQYEKDQRALFGISSEVKGKVADIRFRIDMAEKAREATLSLLKTTAETAMVKAGNIPVSVQTQILEQETKKAQQDVDVARHIIQNFGAAGRHAWAQGAINFSTTEKEKVTRAFNPQGSLTPDVPSSINYWWGDDAAKEQQKQKGPVPIGNFAAANWSDAQSLEAERAIETALSGQSPKVIRAIQGQVRLALMNPTEGVEQIYEKYGLNDMNTETWAAIHSGLTSMNLTILGLKGDPADFGGDATRSEKSREDAAKIAKEGMPQVSLDPEMRQFWTTILTRTMTRIEPQTRAAYASISRKTKYLDKIQEIKTLHPDATPEEVLQLKRKAQTAMDLGDIAWDMAVRRETNPELPLAPEEVGLHDFLMENSPAYRTKAGDATQAAKYLRSPEYLKEWEEKGSDPTIEKSTRAKVQSQLGEAAKSTLSLKDEELTEQDIQREKRAALEGMPASFPQGTGTPASQPSATSQPTSQPAAKAPSPYMLRDLSESYTKKSGATLDPDVQAAITGTYGDYPFTLAGVSLDAMENYPEVQDALAGLKYEPIFTRKLAPNASETYKAFSLQETSRDIQKLLEERGAASAKTPTSTERSSQPKRRPAPAQQPQPSPAPQGPPQGQPMQPGVQPGMQGPQMPQGQPGPMGPPAPPQAPQGGGVGMYNPSQLQQFGPLPGAPPQMSGAFA